MYRRPPERPCIQKTIGEDRTGLAWDGRGGPEGGGPARPRSDVRALFPHKTGRGRKQRATARGTAHSRATPGKAGTVGMDVPLTEGPPHSLHLPEWQGPPLVVGDRARAPRAPPPLRLPGQRAPAAAAGGCQHPLPRGAPAQAPMLPPSQAPTLGRRGCSVPGSRNLRGASLGSRAPHYCFISRGPARNNAGHETEGTRSWWLT